MSNQSAFNSHHLEQVIALQGEELLESCSAIKCRSQQHQKVGRNDSKPDRHCGHFGRGHVGCR